MQTRKRGIARVTIRLDNGAARRDRVVAKNELLELVWPGLVVEENNLQVQVSSLRKVLGPQAITTVPGRGYRFVAPLHNGAADGPAPDAAERRGGALAWRSTRIQRQ